MWHLFWTNGEQITRNPIPMGLMTSMDLFGLCTPDGRLGVAAVSDRGDLVVWRYRPEPGQPGVVRPWIETSRVA